MQIATRLAAESLRLLPRKRLSRMVGRLADLGGPAPVLRRAVDAFIKTYRVDLTEAVVPPGGFSTFDAFFTRALRPGARTVDPDPAVLVSPADGRVDDAGPIDPGATFRVKGALYGVAELLGDPDVAARFDGGTFAVVYLAPPDYHRVHAPADGPVTEMRYVGGTLYPVNAIGTRHVPRLFAKNERVVAVQRVENGADVATVLVGAIGVGRISLSFDAVRTNTGADPVVRRYGTGGPRLARGDEVGAFHLGSTVIVLASEKLRLVPALGARVRMGEALLRREDA